MSDEFIKLFDQLTPLLDSIKNAPPGKPIPPQANPPQGVTDTSAKAYGDAYGQAKDPVKKAVDALTSDQLTALSGLNTDNFHNNNQDGMRTDVINSVLGAWDKSASKYMKSEAQDGDAARSDFKSRLAEFDNAIKTHGMTPVTPDQ